MTDQLPNKPFMGDTIVDDLCWQNIFMSRVNDREPFASAAGYCRLLEFVNCIERDLAAFDNLTSARKLLPPLMARKFFRVIKSDMGKLKIAPAAVYKPLTDLKGLDTYAVIGWLHIVEQMLFLIKSTYNFHYYTKRGEFGFDTWCKYAADDFNFYEDVPYDGELTTEQDALVEIGIAAAVERIDILSDRML